MGPHRLVRYAGWTVAICLAATSGIFSLAQAIVHDDPALAHTLVPADGAITAALAASRAGPTATGSDRRRADQLAREALRRDPTAVAALSTLGIDAQLRGDTPGARRLFAFSQSLSRRDLQTQLWAIEDAVGRGQINEALHHYDLALRVTPASSNALFPVLTAASGEPGISAGLVALLRTKPSWTSNFINYLASHTVAADRTAGLFLQLGARGVDVPQYARSILVNTLVTGGRAEQGWRYYAAQFAIKDRRHSRDPQFSAAFEPPSLFDWSPTNDGNFVTSTGGGAFAFTVPAGGGGKLLQQVQMLPPGRYGLTGRSDELVGADQAQLYWALSCADGRELGRVRVNGAGERSGRFSGQFDVPTGCSPQTLKLVALSSDPATGLSGQIDRAQLSPTS